MLDLSMKRKNWGDEGACLDWNAVHQDPAKLLPGHADSLGGWHLEQRFGGAEVEEEEVPILSVARRLIVDIGLGQAVDDVLGKQLEQLAESPMDCNAPAFAPVEGIGIPLVDDERNREFRQCLR